MDNVEKEIEDSEKVKKDSEAIVYGGIKVNKLEEEILCFPPNHTIFSKVDIEEFDTDMEKCVIKSKWQDNHEKRKLEEMKILEEQKDDTNIVDKEIENKRKGIDFRDMRATEFKNNKRVVLPELDDDQMEIKRNNLKNELKKVVIDTKIITLTKLGTL